MWRLQKPSCSCRVYCSYSPPARCQAAEVWWTRRILMSPAMGPWLKLSGPVINIIPADGPQVPMWDQGSLKVGVINILLSTFNLTTGLHISQVSFIKKHMCKEKCSNIFQVSEFFSHMKIAMFSSSFFYDLQKSFLNKVIWLTWTDCKVYIF